MTQPYRLTLARPTTHPDCIRKTWQSRGGKAVQSDPLFSTLWSYENKEFSDFTGFRDILFAAEAEGTCALVRGIPTPGEGDQRTKRNTDFVGLSNMVSFDLDSVPLPDGTPFPVSQEEFAALAAATHASFPKPFNAIGCVVQFTGSMGVKDQELRARCWFGTEVGITSETLRSHFFQGKNIIDLFGKAAMFDLSVLRPLQLNFLAAPHFGKDVADPVVGPRLYAFADGLLTAKMIDDVAWAAFDIVRVGAPQKSYGGATPASYPGPDHPIAIRTYEERLDATARAGGLVKGQSKNGRNVEFKILVWHGMDVGCSQEYALARTTEWADEESPVRAGESNLLPDDVSSLATALKKFTTHHTRQDLIGCQWRTGLRVDVTDEPEPAFVRFVPKPTIQNPYAGRSYRSPGDGGFDIDPLWIIEDWLADFELAAIVGPSRSGKSFVSCDLAVTLSEGSPWLGKYPVYDKAGVVILAAEAANSIFSRLEGVLKKRGLDPAGRDEDGKFSHSIGMADWHVSDQEDMIEGLREIQKDFDAERKLPLKFVVIDTVSALEAGVKNSGYDDENSNAQIAALLSKYRAVAKATGLKIIYVHHTGKDKQAGLRGAAAFLGNSDAVIMVSADFDEVSGKLTAPRTIAVTKNRGGETGVLAKFRIDNFDLKRIHPQTKKALHVGVMEVMAENATDPAVKPPETKEKKMTTADTALLALGDAADGLTTKDWHAAAVAKGVPRASASAAIKELMGGDAPRVVFDAATGLHTRTVPKVVPVVIQSAPEPYIGVDDDPLGF